MARKRKNRERTTLEWDRSPDNVGVMLPWPIGIFYDYLRDNNILDIVGMFWNPTVQNVNMLDVCVLSNYWWKDGEILAARTSWHKHPHHHSSDLVFDKKSQRLIVTFKQPDMDGKHWEADHLHMTIGSISQNDACGVEKPICKRRHVVFDKVRVDPVYVNPNFIVKIKKEKSR